MAADSASLKPLDAVISGYAYENATTAICVFEEGPRTKRWIPQARQWQPMSQLTGIPLPP